MSALPQLLMHQLRHPRVAREAHVFVHCVAPKHHRGSNPFPGEQRVEVKDPGEALNKRLPQFKPHDELGGATTVLSLRPIDVSTQDTEAFKRGGGLRLWRGVTWGHSDCPLCFMDWGFSVEESRKGNQNQGFRGASLRLCVELTCRDHQELTAAVIHTDSTSFATSSVAK